ncbi:MAG: hypothetical protein LBE52_16115 [Providencia sp.]|jgi:hypothetical protein|nr:hypothetical protein [Providencia sp.]
MSSQYKKLEEEVKTLEKKADQLYLSMLKACGYLDEDEVKKYEKDGIKFISFDTNYQRWYTKAYRVIKQIIPERLAEFEKMYKGDEKRKEVSLMNYSIYDYMLGLESSIGGKVIASRKNAIQKMETQCLILSSAAEKFKSSLFDIVEVLQADLFDTELDSASELNKKGFSRAAGAVTGVVLEKHLSHICSLHELKPKKANPSISDFYQLLKDNEIIDTPTWRFIQHLGDIRNLCDHNKEREPTKDEVTEFIKGVDKVIKTVF